MTMFEKGLWSFVDELDIDCSMYFIVEICDDKILEITFETESHLCPLLLLCNFSIKI